MKEKERNRIKKHLEIHISELVKFLDNDKDLYFALKSRTKQQIKHRVAKIRNYIAKFVQE